MPPASSDSTHSISFQHSLLPVVTAVSYSQHSQQHLPLQQSLCQLQYCLYTQWLPTVLAVPVAMDTARICRCWPLSSSRCYHKSPTSPTLAAQCWHFTLMNILQLLLLSQPTSGVMQGHPHPDASIASHKTCLTKLYTQT